MAELILAYFFDNDIGNSENNSNKYGFKSRNCPPQNNDMEKFEDDVLLMIKNIENLQFISSEECVNMKLKVTKLL